VCSSNWEQVVSQEWLVGVVAGHRDPASKEECRSMLDLVGDLPCFWCSWIVDCYVYWVSFLWFSVVAQGLINSEGS